jgi:TetR/AcrR family transcriptional regulator, cholesterol catabolism regulator
VHGVEPASSSERKAVVAVGDKLDSSAWHQRRNDIVDTAARLFAANGYHATGVAELGEAVGLGRGALYYYIDSKENLLTLIHDRVIVDVLDAGEKAAALEGSASDRLRFLGHQLVNIIASFPDHVWVFLHEFRHLQGQPAEDFRKSRRAFERTIERILVDGVDSGEFEVANTRLAALGWLGLHNYVYIWHHSGGPFTPDLIAGNFADIFLFGIRSR